MPLAKGLLNTRFKAISAVLIEYRPCGTFSCLHVGTDVAQAMLADIALRAITNSNRNESVKVWEGIV